MLDMGRVRWVDSFSGRVLPLNQRGQVFGISHRLYHKNIRVNEKNAFEFIAPWRSPEAILPEPNFL